MKHLRKVFASTVLICVLSTASFAGEIGTQYTPPPPPTPATTEGDMSAGVAGEIGTQHSETIARTSVPEFILNLLHSTLSLF